MEQEKQGSGFSLELRKQLGVFLGITFGVYWGAIIIAWINNVHYGDSVFDVIYTEMMLLPALVALISRKICREPATLDSLWIPPHIRGNVIRYLFAYFFPAVLALFGSLLFFALYSANFDPQSTTALSIFTEAGFSQEKAKSMLYSLVGRSVFLSPLVNSVIGFTEMLGFQGYLIPKLVKCFSAHAQLKASLLGSAIWSVWYLPLYFDGFQYGGGYPGEPVLGAFLGLAFYFLLGIILSYLTLRTGSVFPAGLIRGGIMATAAIGVYFTKGETSLLIGPSTYGYCGCIVLLLMAGGCAYLILRTEKSGKFFDPAAWEKKRKSLPEPKKKGTKKEESK